MSIKLNGATSGSVSLDVPAAVSGGDISLTLPNGVGSAGQVLRNSGTAGTLEFATLATVSTLGDGQTWQNVLSSRAAATTYTNTTGRTIVVNIVTQVNESGDLNQIQVDGVNVCQNHTASVSGANNRERMTMTAIVPDSSTYQLTSVGAGLILWAELR